MAPTGRTLGPLPLTPCCVRAPRCAVECPVPISQLSCFIPTPSRGAELAVLPQAGTDKRSPEIPAPLIRAGQSGPVPSPSPSVATAQLHGKALRACDLAAVLNFSLASCVNGGGGVPASQGPSPHCEMGVGQVQVPVPPTMGVAIRRAWEAVQGSAVWLLAGTCGWKSLDEGYVSSSLVYVLLWAHLICSLCEGPREGEVGNGRVGQCRPLEAGPVDFSVGPQARSAAGFCGWLAVYLKRQVQARM